MFGYSFLNLISHLLLLLNNNTEKNPNSSSPKPVNQLCTRIISYKASYPNQEMSLSSKAWIVATSVGAVEALKDQGICRWNHVLRSLHQHAKTNLRSFSQANKNNSSSSSAAAVTRLQRKVREDKLRQSEESLRKVMYLSCWGPN